MTRSAAPTVLAETPAWLVLDKPAGWHTVEVRESDGGPSVQAWLARERPELAGLPESGLMQRLDRWTSGCVLVARTSDAATSLRERIAAGPGSGSIGKTYLALTAPGLAPEGSWSLHFTSRHRGSAKVTVGRRGDDASLGECAWRVRSAAEEVGPLRRTVDAPSSAALALATPVAARRHVQASPPRAFDLTEIELHGPGRRHQIRAGFAFIGHALAGDTLYGGRPLEDADGPVTDRPTLHAWRLVIDDRTIESPAPAWAQRSADR